jgi:hypothetical protein
MSPRSDSSSSSGSEVQITSLMSSDFGSGRWAGGRGTVTDAWYEYRTAEGSRGKFTVIEAHVKIEDADGADHEPRYGAGSGEFGCIREEPEPDARETENGYALSGRNGKQFKVNADSELGQLLLSLYNNGVAESKIGRDIRNLIGIEAEWVERPHAGIKQGQVDKYPMLLASEVYNVSRGKGKSAATSDAPAKRRVAEDDEPAPKKNGFERRALKLVIAAAKDNDGTTTANDVVRSAAKELKGDDDRKDILDLLGDDDWLGKQDEWKYKPRTGEITLQ